MRLPDNSIGISDILKFQECRRRMGYQMRRWTEGEQPPEDVHPDTMYGTVFHDTVELVERDDLSDDEALQRAFDMHAEFLDPEDLPKIKKDLETYRERDEIGVRTVANEKEIKVPLMEWPCFECAGKGAIPVPSSGDPTIPEPEPCPDCNATGTVTIYFRGRIDRLYQRLDDETVFIHRDYKSSKWQKTEEEIHEDKQFSAYNFAIHEHWPEVETLHQYYDQLRYGAVPTHRSERQRKEMREWLVRQVTTILKAEEPLKPLFNQWCPWCPIKMDCPVIDRLSEFETARIKALLPPDEDPDPDALGAYVAKLSDVGTAIKTLEAFQDRVKKVIRELPAAERDETGYKLQPRSIDTYDDDGLRAAHEVLGDDFYRVAGLTKKRIENFLADDPRAEQVLALARKRDTTPQLRKASGG